MLSLKIQYWAGRIAVFFLAPLYIIVLRFFFKYRLRNLSEVRRKWRMLLEEHRGPWIVCANHLTLIDSLILTYGLYSLWDHIVYYDTIPWNLPEKRNFQKNLALVIFCYLAKCIPVERGGDREGMKKTVEKCNTLLTMGQSLLIFPEGRRSRKGRVDVENYAYGVGRFVAEHSNCRVLLAYLRGDGQETFSDYPKRGETFIIMLKPFEVPSMGLQGLRGHRERAKSIVEELAKMEDEYFRDYRQ
ncbi:MAG: 1-acyl-sn-glycerol-3-phosphate acyltransferase [Syntrophales bacterium]|nr:1-acyl-sn-glycerol-3-phosphate acyltransferase [Syntrophales bacterium]